MNITQSIARVLDESLSLNGRAATFNRDTPLLGALPELDSMAVLILITRLEEEYGLVVEDEDMNSDTFATVGSLTDYVCSKLTS